MWTKPILKKLYYSHQSVVHARPLFHRLIKYSLDICTNHRIAAEPRRCAAAIPEFINPMTFSNIHHKGNRTGKGVGEGALGWSALNVHRTFSSHDALQDVAGELVLLQTCPDLSTGRPLHRAGRALSDSWTCAVTSSSGLGVANLTRLHHFLYSLVTQALVTTHRPGTFPRLPNACREPRVPTRTALKRLASAMDRCARLVGVFKVESNSRNSVGRRVETCLPSPRRARPSLVFVRPLRCLYSSVAETWETATRKMDAVIFFHCWLPGVSRL